MKESFEKSEFMERLYEFKGKWDVPSICGIRVVKGKSRHIVIATELYDKNPGTSVADFSAGLAGLLCRERGLDPAKLVFIEYCPDRGSKLKNYRETFHRVAMTWEDGKFSNPDWHELSADQVRALLKGE